MFRKTQNVQVCLTDFCSIMKCLGKILEISGPVSDEWRREYSLFGMRMADFRKFVSAVGMKVNWLWLIFHQMKL